MRPRTAALALAAVLALWLALLSGQALRALSEGTYKMKPILALAMALLLSACATADIAELMQAAENYDPGCYKRTELKVTPVLVFGWPFPLVSGEHVKVCNPGQAAPTAPPGDPIGALIPLEPAQ